MHLYSLAVQSYSVEKWWSYDEFLKLRDRLIRAMIRLDSDSVSNAKWVPDRFWEWRQTTYRQEYFCLKAVLHVAFLSQMWKCSAFEDFSSFLSRLRRCLCFNIETWERGTTRLQPQKGEMQFTNIEYCRIGLNFFHYTITVFTLEHLAKIRHSWILSVHVTLVAVPVANSL